MFKVKEYKKTSGNARSIYFKTKNQIFDESDIFFTKSSRISKLN
jgi:hypothetical protein